jgi:hypothetical protein
VNQLAEPFVIETVQTRALTYRSAVIVACVLCAILTLAGLLAPPSLSHDAGWGMQEWRTYIGGGPINTTATPDGTDIATDQTNFVTWWSPGQYVIPGVVSLAGLRIGSALAITSGLSLLCCLLGWIYLAKLFDISPFTTLLIVAAIATFRYSTLPFDVYNGGEILLQGLTPWLIVIGYRVPSATLFRAAALTFLAVLLAFFVKLTGLIVAGAALIAGSAEVLRRLRKITLGMIGGVAGSALAFVVLYLAWFSRGSTPASGAGWSIHVKNILYAFGAPWGAGVSWTDMLTSVLYNAQHPILRGIPQNGDVTIILWLLLIPITIFAAVIAVGWRNSIDDAKLNRLLPFAVLFYLICAAAMAMIFSHGGDVSLEERHLRAAGTLIFVCVAAIAGKAPRKALSKIALVAFCAFMSLYGCLAFGYRAMSLKKAEIDPYSLTHQPSVDQTGIAFLRSAFAREGRDALFVLPSPDVALEFPPSARIISNHIEFDTEAMISERAYHGKVKGSLYVIMPTRIAESAKGPLVLKEFIDYPADAWRSEVLGNSTIFIQQGAGS